MVSDPIQSWSQFWKDVRISLICGVIIYTLTIFSLDRFSSLKASTFVSLILPICNPNFMWALQAQHSRQRVQPIQKIPSTHQWATCPSWAGSALLAGSWQPVHVGPNPCVHKQNRLSQSGDGPNPRVATQTPLSLHLSILPSKEGYPQETPSKHQFAVWLGDPLASRETQIHSSNCSPNLVFHHHPCLRVKH